MNKLDRLGVNRQLSSRQCFVHDANMVTVLHLYQLLNTYRRQYTSLLQQFPKYRNP